MVTRVCVFGCPSPHSQFLTLLHGPGCNFGNGRGCPTVVHYWADLQSVRGFRCYDNIAPNAKCQRVLYARSMPGCNTVAPSACRGRGKIHACSDGYLRNEIINQEIGLHSTRTQRVFHLTGKSVLHVFCAPGFSRLIPTMAIYRFFKMATVCYIGFVVGKLGPPKGVLGDFCRCAKFG